MLKKISTKKRWKDLKLKPEIQKKIEKILQWLEANDVTKKSKIRDTNKPSAKELWLYGSTKTLKRSVASLIGQQSGRGVYQVNLSRAMSKYIGETEKNLDKIFSKAEDKNWILFFDEADSLFGKRTDVKDSHDRYSNQEQTFIQKRIQHFPGLAILSFNVNPNPEEAGSKHIHSIIRFE